MEWAGEGREEELLDDNLWSLEERAEAEERKHKDTLTPAQRTEQGTCTVLYSLHTLVHIINQQHIDHHTIQHSTTGY